METKGQFTAPSLVGVEGVIIKLDNISTDTREFTQLLVRGVSNGGQRGEISLIQVNHELLNGAMVGSEVYVQCERRIAGVTQYVSKLDGIVSHTKSGLSASNVVVLSGGDPAYEAETPQIS